MPKVVDHDERREHIAAALWRVAADDGLEAVSLSRVATEAGVSKGRVQHYFASRDELLDYAGRRLVARVRGRSAERLAAVDGADPLARLRVLLRAVLPLDDASRSDARVRSAFLVRALGDPALVREYREGNQLLLTAAAGYLHAAGVADDRAARGARVLVALVEGLGTAVLLGEETAESAAALVDDEVARAAG